LKPCQWLKSSNTISAGWRHWVVAQISDVPPKHLHRYLLVLPVMLSRNSLSSQTGVSAFQRCTHVLQNLRFVSVLLRVELALSFSCSSCKLCSCLFFFNMTAVIVPKICFIRFLSVKPSIALSLASSGWGSKFGLKSGVKIQIPASLLQVWGSEEALERERRRVKKFQVKQKKKLHGAYQIEVGRLRRLLKSSQGKVVLYAAAAWVTLMLLLWYSDVVAENRMCAGRELIDRYLSV